MSGIQVADPLLFFKVVAYLHDIGKASEPYQDNFTDDCEPKTEKASFRFHEIGSAVATYKLGEVLRRGEGGGGSRGDAWLVASAVQYNHLNAMRNVSQLLERGFEKSLRLSKHGNEFLRRLGERDPEFATVVGGFKVEDYPLDEVKTLRWEILKFSRRHVKAYLLFLAPVIIGDNLDSAESRNHDEDSKPKRGFIAHLHRSLNT